jgi:hypothetical protein
LALPGKRLNTARRGRRRRAVILLSLFLQLKKIKKSLKFYFYLASKRTRWWLWCLLMTVQDFQYITNLERQLEWRFGEYK